MYDRAMQALYALALEPVAETTADTKSFGFRKGRCCQDACEHIFAALSRQVSPEWILEGDIKGCFDNISHEWLIKKYSDGQINSKAIPESRICFQRRAVPDRGWHSAGRRYLSDSCEHGTGRYAESIVGQIPHQQAWKGGLAVQERP